MDKDIVGNVIGKVMDGIVNNPLLKNVKKYAASEEGKKVAEKFRELFTFTEEEEAKEDTDKEN